MVAGVTSAQTAKAYEIMHRWQQAGLVNLEGMDAGRFNSLFEKAAKMDYGDTITLAAGNPSAAAQGSTALMIRPANASALAPVDAPVTEAKGILASIKEKAVELGKKGLELVKKGANSFKSLPIVGKVAVVAAGVLAVALGGKIIYDQGKKSAQNS